jgi:hypothetical protein
VWPILQYLVSVSLFILALRGCRRQPAARTAPFRHDRLALLP